MPPKKVAAPKENISLGPSVRDGTLKFSELILQHSRHRVADNACTGELVFGVARIFASFNDTFVHVTDLRFVLPRN